MALKPATFSIDEKVKKDFKAECVINSVEMSTTIQDFMYNYVLASKKLRNNNG